MPAFRPFDKSLDFPAREAEILAFWREHGIFAKQLERGRARAKAEGRSTHVFYEGPPTANGRPHPGHVLTRVVKDLFPRFKAMQGFDVPRKAGWDTHGLPVEIEVEKELGIEGKQGIETYGVEAFARRCKDSVFRYSDLWARLTERIGFWIDLADPYVTYHQSYIESVWWSLKEIWDAGLLYHGFKIVPWCPRCGTGLSSHEVGLGYREVADPSAFVAFRSTEDPKLLFLAWTTTPWTLPSNVALAVGAEHDYDFVRAGEETLVVASALRAAAFGKIPHEVTRTVKGRELAGRTYEPLFPFAKVEKPAFRIILADFVGLDAGTGIVHIAPAFGEDDARAGRDNDLPAPNLVRPDGAFAEGTPWAGTFVKDADPLILKELKNRKLLLKSETCKHDYPFCWRCDSPLLYYPRPAWYIATSTLKARMLENNAAVTWLPDHIRTGRFGNFLETNVDWALSRERYWGTPLPIWACTGCGYKTAVSGRAELAGWKQGVRWAPPGKDPVHEGSDGLPADLELHKPWIDGVALGCPECSSWLRRVSEVIDCWYDSGAMPFAQWGYPAGRPDAPGASGRGSEALAREAEEKLAAALPADFICEAIDQTRGWFYSLLAIATLLGECADRKRAKGLPPGPLAPWTKGGPLPYRRCLVLGHVCDEKGFKMSKSKGNYLDPWKILDTQGADALRWTFYSSNHPWTSVRFSEAGVRDAQKDFLIRLQNVLSFFLIYAGIDGFLPETIPGGAPVEGGWKTPPLAERPLLDRWMVSKVERTTKEVTAHLEAMNILAAAGALHELVDMLSNWYVRRSRDRFWKGAADADKRAAYGTLYDCLGRLSLLLAPFTPFFAEELHRTLVRPLAPEKAPESVHLAAWPAADETRIDPGVEGLMDLVREVASLGLSARAARKIKVRQPLAEAVVVLRDPALRPGLESLAAVIREEINVKALRFADDASAYVTWSVKPNFETLGPRLGPKVRACAAALAREDAAAVVRAAQAGRSVALGVEGETIELAPTDLDIRLQAKEGFAAADGRGAVVALDTRIDEALELEGVAREIINRIQTLRKELDLPFEARIAVRLGAGGKAARAALRFADLIAGETLAADFRAEFEDLGGTRELVIEDEQVRLSIRAV